MAALLDRPVRDRELISKVYNEVLSLRSEMHEVSSEVREVKSDLMTLENQMRNRHNEVLSVIRRLDALGAPPD